MDLALALSLSREREREIGDEPSEFLLDQG